MKYRLSGNDFPRGDCCEGLSGSAAALAWCLVDSVIRGEGSNKQTKSDLVSVNSSGDFAWSTVVFAEPACSLTPS